MVKVNLYGIEFPAVATFEFDFREQELLLEE